MSQGYRVRIPLLIGWQAFLHDAFLHAACRRYRSASPASEVVVLTGSVPMIEGVLSRMSYFFRKTLKPCHLDVASTFFETLPPCH